MMMTLIHEFTLFSTHYDRTFPDEFSPTKTLSEVSQNDFIHEYSSNEA